MFKYACFFFWTLSTFRSTVPNCLNLIGAANDNMFKENLILNLIHSCRVNKNFVRDLSGLVECNCSIYPIFFTKKFFKICDLSGPGFKLAFNRPPVLFFFSPKCKEKNLFFYDHFKEFFSIPVFVQVPT
jgi:hypothetical protein